MKAETFTTYQEALDWLHGLSKFGQKPGLERMQWMLEELDHPERRLAFVHVAGTNGKGSTCAYIARMLREAGYRVGTFTSPYLTDFRERIACNGDPIPEEEVRRLAGVIKPLAERCASESPFGAPTEFEVVTVMALLYFADVVKPPVVIWETGLGGRLDSTNVVFPLVSVITNVGMDHTDVLGGTLEAIAREKAGIIKPGVPVVLGDVAPEALAVIEETARRKKAAVYRLGREFQAEPVSLSLGETRFRYRSVHRRGECEYTLAMSGAHQVDNAAVALAAVDVLREFFAFLLEEEEVARGLQQMRWPGRLEVVCERPLVILDGAHNAEGMAALAAGMQRLLPEGKRLTLLVAALADKPLREMARAWREHGPEPERIAVTTFDFPRASTAEALADAFVSAGWEAGKVVKADDWRTLLTEWMDRGAEDACYLVCGSLYFIAHVRPLFPTSEKEAGE